MRLPHLAGCAIIGISPLLWLPALPNMLSVWCLIGAALIIATLRKPCTTYAALTLLFSYGEYYMPGKRCGPLSIFPVATDRPLLSW